MAEVYSPEEDSYFFTEFLKKYFFKLKNKNIKYLDMGTGSGILAKIASKFLDKKNILCVDVNISAVKNLKKEGFNAVRSDLFSNVSGNFDLITFNAPYLPEDSREPKNSHLATTGGEKGDEISVEFLTKAKKYLKKNGKIFLLISSFTPMSRIKKFNGKVVARKKIFFEELRILGF